jgi:ABC-type multidrug transport system fused ATPase/permease subunit
MIIQFTLSTITAILDFSGPLFLKLILDCISAFNSQRPHTESQLQAQDSLVHPQGYPTAARIRALRANAVVYALLYLVIQFLKSFLISIYLKHGRRAACRTKSELMTLIYDKALRRRELLTPPQATEEKEKMDEKTDKTDKTDKTKKTDQEKATKEKEAGDKKEKASAADLGRIVTLMSTDVRSLEMAINIGFIFYVSFFFVVSTFFTL